MKAVNSIPRTIPIPALGLVALGLVPPAVGEVPVTNDLALWLDAAQLKGLDNGNTVSTWTDTSGKANNAFLVNTAPAPPALAVRVAECPTYQTGVVSGQPAVRFGGLANGPAMSLESQRISTIRTVFLVVQKTPGAFNLRFMLGDDTEYDFRPGDKGNLWSADNTSPHILGGATRLMGSPPTSATMRATASRATSPREVTRASTRSSPTSACGFWPRPCGIRRPITRASWPSSCHGDYGPAGPAVLKYIDTIHRPVRQDPRLYVRGYTGFDAPWLEPSLLAEAESHLRRAEAAVASDPVLLDRVCLAHVPLQYPLVLHDDFMPGHNSTLFVRVRCPQPTAEGHAFACGIHGKDPLPTIRKSVPTRDLTPNRYQTVEVGTLELKPGHAFWIATAKNKDGYAVPDGSTGLSVAQADKLTNARSSLQLHSP